MTRDELLAARAASWADADRAAVAAVVTALRPSPRHLADVLDWLDDVATRDHVTRATILADAQLRAALASPGSPPDRLKRWKEALRKVRFPRLADCEREFAAAVRDLNFGRAIAVTVPPGFEGGELTIVIRAKSVADLERSLDDLERARRSEAIARLFALLE